MATMIAHVCDDLLMYGKLKVVLKRWGLPNGKLKIKKKKISYTGYETALLLLT